MLGVEGGNAVADVLVRQIFACRPIAGGISPHHRRCAVQLLRKCHGPTRRSGSHEGHGALSRSAHHAAIRIRPRALVQRVPLQRSFAEHAVRRRRANASTSPSRWRTRRCGQRRSRAALRARSGGERRPPGARTARIQAHRSGRRRAQARHFQPHAGAVRILEPARAVADRSGPHRLLDRCVVGGFARQWLHSRSRKLTPGRRRRRRCPPGSSFQLPIDEGELHAFLVSHGYWPCHASPRWPCHCRTGGADQGSRKRTIDRWDPAMDAIVPKDWKIEKLAEGFGWAEGPDLGQVRRLSTVHRRARQQDVEVVGEGRPREIPRSLRRRQPSTRTSGAKPAPTVSPSSTRRASCWPTPAAAASRSSTSTRRRRRRWR